jgi:hypothetical protein
MIRVATKLNVIQQRYHFNYQTKYYETQQNNERNISVRSTARRVIHLQFDISANAVEIRAVQNPKCIV